MVTSCYFPICSLSVRLLLHLKLGFHQATAVLTHRPQFHSWKERGGRQAACGVRDLERSKQLQVCNPTNPTKTDEIAAFVFFNDPPATVTQTTRPQNGQRFCRPGGWSPVVPSSPEDQNQDGRIDFGESNDPGVFCGG